jgi:hypothetical protein
MRTVNLKYPALAINTQIHVKAIYVYLDDMRTTIST